MLTFDAATHTYRWNGRVVPSVTQLLDRARQGADYSRIAPHVLAHAAERARYVEACCDAYDAGELDLDGVAEEARPYLRAYMAFRDETGFVRKSAQNVLFHEPLDYCGTDDLDGTFPAGSPHAGDWVLDMKATSALADGYHLQTAAYTHPGIAVWDGTQLRPRGKRRRGVLWLRGNGKWQLVDSDAVAAERGRDDHRAWLAVLTIARWREAA